MSNPNDSNPNLSPERQATQPFVVPQGTPGGNKQAMPPSPLRETHPSQSENLDESENKDTSSKSNVESVSDQLKGTVEKVKQAASGGKEEGGDQTGKEESTGNVSTSQESQESQSKESVPKTSDAGGTGGIPNPTTKMAAAAAVTGAPVFVESDSIIDLIIADHNKAKDLFEKYKQEDSRSEKKTIANELIRTLVSHDECEQLLVYSLLKEKLSGENNDQIYDRSLKEHQEQRELLYEVKNTDINKEFEKYDSTLKKAMASVLHHVELEEREVLPFIQKGMTEEELKKVGASFRAHKPLCATHPHPSAPQTGFPAAAGNILLAPFDAVRDFLEG